MLKGFLTHRAKRAVWPSIPNPEKSNTMQKMEMTNELVGSCCDEDEEKVEGFYRTEGVLAPLRSCCSPSAP